MNALAELGRAAEAGVFQRLARHDTKPYLPQAPLSRAVFLENYWGKSYQAIPRHSADVADLLADACGVSIGLALAYTRLGRVLLWIKSAFTTNPGQDG